MLLPNLTVAVTSADASKSSTDKFFVLPELPVKTLLPSPLVTAVKLSELSKPAPELCVNEKEYEPGSGGKFTEAVETARLALGEEYFEAKTMFIRFGSAAIAFSKLTLSKLSVPSLSVFTPRLAK